MSPIGGSVNTYRSRTFQAETTAWVAAVVTNGGSVTSGRKVVVDDLIAGLKTDSVFSGFDRLWLHAGEDQPSALTDIIATALATAVNSPAFVVDRGYTSDGTTSYINSGYNPTTNGAQYTLNSASLGLWIGNPGGSDIPFIGVVEPGPAHIARFHTGGGYFFEINQDGGSTVGNPGAGSGLYANSRTGSTTLTPYANGSSYSTSSTVSTGIPNANMYIIAENQVGVGPSLNTNPTTQCAAAFFGKGFNATEMANIYSRLRTYMTAVGVP